MCWFLHEFRIPSAFSCSWRRSHLRVLRRSGRCVCVSSVSRGRSEIQNKQKPMCFLEMRLRVRMSRAGESVQPILLSRPGFPSPCWYGWSEDILLLLPELQRALNTLRKTAALVWVSQVWYVCYTCVMCSPGPDFLLPSP